MASNYHRNLLNRNVSKFAQSMLLIVMYFTITQSKTNKTFIFFFMFVTSLDSSPFCFLIILTLKSKERDDMTRNTEDKLNNDRIIKL